MNHHITNANIKEWARDYDGPQFDGILCDPPYELGFMGKSWDSSGIAFDKDMWADILKLLKPGGHLLAFSGSRTYHRMAVAIEDAGFEIRDMIEWVYGSGFPKSHNLALAIDKMEGATGHRGKAINIKGAGTRKDIQGIEKQAQNSEFYHKPYNEPLTENAKYWNGYGTALKPAHEPCVLARKPIEGTVANNVLKHGTGGLNIDGTRVGTEEVKVATTEGGKFAMWNKDGDNKGFTRHNGNGTAHNLGRFPANLIHDGSDEVVGLFPQTKTGKVASHSDKGMWGSGADTSYNDPGGGGSASRFFYTAKASKSERNAGLEGFEDIKLDIGDDRPSGSFNERFGHNEPRPTKNAHPTVKPLSLTKYLATLIKPPTGGRLLVPFSGSGSEMIGALQAGWEYVEGVELTEEYIPIAEARIKYWLDQMAQEDAKPKQESLL